jgi:MSHA pilin protein MshD
MTERMSLPGAARQRGITLIEMIVTMVILAVALTGVTVALSGGIGRSADVLTGTRTVALAQSYLDEILGKGFDEASNPRGIPPCRNNCTDPDGFGPDGGENGRADFDDVDDYIGLDEGWQTAEPLRDAEGNPRTGYESFRVRVSVRYLDLSPGGAEESLGATPADLDDARDAKLITVTVSHPDNPDGWRFSAYKANF